MKRKSIKLYFRLQCDAKNHTIIRVDNIPVFNKYIQNPLLDQYFKTQVSLIALGQTVKAEPYVYDVKEAEFTLLVKEIKSKISNKWKSDFQFNSISMVADSAHYPLIKIVPINRETEVKEKAL